MSYIFDRLIKHSQDFKDILGSRAFPSEEGKHNYPWENNIYVSGLLRRAHLDVVDARETKKLYMMHLCIFPKVHCSAPVYGFDLIAGPSKVTGAFHDFSPTGDKDHQYCKWFENEVKDTQWSKPRELPEWAKNIFSPSMVAAGNIRTDEELEEVLELSKRSLLYYMDNLYGLHGEGYDAMTKKYDFTKEQNWYCQNQKRNPHTPRVMESLGYDTETVQKFIQECLFPEV